MSDIWCFTQLCAPVGNGLAHSVGEAAFATAIVLKTVGKMQRLTFFAPSGAAMPLRGRNEPQPRSFHLVPFNETMYESEPGGGSKPPALRI